MRETCLTNHIIRDDIADVVSFRSLLFTFSNKVFIFSDRDRSIINFRKSMVGFFLSSPAATSCGTTYYNHFSFLISSAQCHLLSAYVISRSACIYDSRIEFGSRDLDDVDLIL